MPYIAYFVKALQTSTCLARMRKRHKSTFLNCYLLLTINFFGRYDRLAFRYVSYVAIPLLAGYTIYSLIYEAHRGWYSFVISTLTSFVYMFGFVSSLFTVKPAAEHFPQAQLIPQLIINYKLKVFICTPVFFNSMLTCACSTPQSVAHMPMKAMVYKTLSTVVDDFFAYVLRL